jgi:hypothetical protein
MSVSSEQRAAGPDRAAAQQRGNLCGPFHGARVLLDAGVGEWQGTPVDQDLVALHAGTTLPLPARGPQVPAGAERLLDYRYALPQANPERAGTTPGGLARALVLLSGERLECVPLRGRWSEVGLESLLEAAPRLGARLIANLRTGALWGSRPPLGALLAELAGAPPRAAPAADWDVGHFVELVQLIRGTDGALVVVRDSYPSLGWDGHHLQPPRAVVAALLRGDGREGGVLAVVPAGGGGAVRRLAAQLALEAELWHN